MEAFVGSHSEMNLKPLKVKKKFCLLSKMCGIEPGKPHQIGFGDSGEWLQVSEIWKHWLSSSLEISPESGTPSPQTLMQCAGELGKGEEKWKPQLYCVQGRPSAATSVSCSFLWLRDEAARWGHTQPLILDTNQALLDASQKAYLRTQCVLLVRQGCLSVMSILLREHW